MSVLLVSAPASVSPYFLVSVSAAVSLCLSLCLCLCWSPYISEFPPNFLIEVAIFGIAIFGFETPQSCLNQLPHRPHPSSLSGRYCSCLWRASSCISSYAHASKTAFKIALTPLSAVGGIVFARGWRHRASVSAHLPHPRGCGRAPPPLHPSPAVYNRQHHCAQRGIRL